MAPHHDIELSLRVGDRFPLTRRQTRLDRGPLVVDEITARHAMAGRDQGTSCGRVHNLMIRISNRPWCNDHEHSRGWSVAGLPALGLVTHGSRRRWTDRLRLLAWDVMERAIQPYDRRTGHNHFYRQRESLGEVEEYRQGLELYLRILAADAKTSIDEPRDLGCSWPRRKERSPSPAEIELMRQRLLSLAPAFQAFPPHVFGGSASEESYVDSLDLSGEMLQIVAGACVHRSGVLIENLRHDLDVLGETGGTVADIGPNRFRELTELSWKFASSYDEEFVRRFLESAIDATTRLLQPGRLRPRTIAEYLAVFSVTASLSDLACRYGGLDDDEERLVDARVSRAFSYATAGFSDLSLSFAPSTTALSRITPLLGTAWLKVFENPWVVPPEKWFLPFPGDLKRPGRRARGPSGNRQR